MSADACPAAAPGTAEPRPEVAEIFRRFGPAYLRNHVLSPEQAQVLRHINDCRTPALGGEEKTCDHCGVSFTRWFSCRDRHCPTCQGVQQLTWIANRLKRVVPTHYFHVVFTLPAELRSLALANRKLVYDLLFSAATETLLELASTHWGALPGITAVLHTWTRQLEFHPHLHCIVTGGGLDADDGWASCERDFLFPVHVLSKPGWWRCLGDKLAPANVPTKLAKAIQVLDGARRQRAAARQESPSEPTTIARCTPNRQCPTCQVGQLRVRLLPPARAPPVAP